MRQPDFIFKNAVVIIDGKREVVKDTYITSSGGNHHYATDELMLRLKGGKKDVMFDYDKVKQPQGTLPDFIAKGAKIEIQGTGAGAWEIRNFHFEQREVEPAPRLVLQLFREDQGHLRREFNDKTMSPVVVVPPPVPEVPKIQLIKKIVLKKPGR